MHQFTTPTLSQTIWPRWASIQFVIVPIVQTLFPVTFAYSLSSEAVVMRQLRKWKRLWRRFWHAHTRGLPWGLQEIVEVHCSRRRLLRKGQEFHVCTINKSAHTKKKSGNLLKAPRILYNEGNNCFVKNMNVRERDRLAWRKHFNVLNTSVICKINLSDLSKELSYLILLSVKQGGIKYHFWSLWYDSTWDWTPISRTIYSCANKWLLNRNVYFKPNIQFALFFSITVRESRLISASFLRRFLIIHS